MKTEKQTNGQGTENAIKDALREWKDAVTYFENVKEPELVDYASFCIETARRKYVYLLRHGGET